MGDHEDWRAHRAPERPGFNPWLREQRQRQDIVGALARYVITHHPFWDISLPAWFDWLECRPAGPYDDLLWWAFKAAEREYLEYRQPIVFDFGRPYPSSPLPPRRKPTRDPVPT